MLASNPSFSLYHLADFFASLTRTGTDDISVNMGKILLLPRFKRGALKIGRPVSGCSGRLSLRLASIVPSPEAQGKGDSSLKISEIETY
jgi:hypothetical protein